MTASPPSEPQGTPPAQARSDPHIVDILIEERARHLLHMPVVWPLIKSIFYPLLHYRSAKRMADTIAPLDGNGALGHIAQTLALDVRMDGLENLPPTGKVIVVSNHPTGIADGIALFQGLAQVRGDQSIFANRDAVRVAPGLAQNIIPVEWVEEKRTREKTRETLKLATKAFEAGRVVVIFPSGRLAHITLGGLKERPWLTTTLSLARRHKAPILPIHIRARNSLLYYALHCISNELRDMTLFNELLNKRGRTYRMTVGPLIDPGRLDGDPEVQIRRLQTYVEHTLKKDPAARF